MIHQLRQLETKGRPLRIGLAGAGAMGRGIAMQVHHTPGMTLAWIADLDESAAIRAAGLADHCPTGPDPRSLLESHPVDVFVESTNSIGPAAEFCFAALETGAHVVLMNAEVDLALGPLLKHEADQRDLVVTSDAGDQHGVLATMIDEAALWGFDIIQAGNIKGFLDRSATPESIAAEAAKRKLSPTQCCAYTDGTKLEIEMAVLANGFGYRVPDGGMTGPRATDVREALDLFDFDARRNSPHIDYILGAEPGGGVYLVAEPRDVFPADHAFYLDYYKIRHRDGRHLLYRPHHLCHLETPRAIAQAALLHQPVLQARHTAVDVYAHAKRDLRAGDTISHAIGSAECYGLARNQDEVQAEGLVPITLLEATATVRRDIPRDAPLRSADLDMPDSPLARHWNQQSAL